MARGDLIRAELLNQPFIMCPAKMQTYINVLNDGVLRVDDVGVANNNVVYTKVDDVAVIAIDGAMYKKEFKGACGESVVAYPNIVKAIDMAESDKDISTMFFRVDTGGGSVAGAEEVRFRIKNSKKKTVTFYENLGASGGIWIFTASDEVYAAPSTWLGSVGVVIEYEDEDNKKTKQIVSEDSPNKRCELNGDCESVMQSMVNTIAQDFFNVLEENTGFKKAEIKEIFQNGGIIKAEIAKEKGFIKDIRQFSVLLSEIKSKQGVTMENTSQASEEVNVNADAKQFGGLAFNEENFATLIESRQKLNATISSLNEAVKTANLGLQEVQEKLVAREKIISEMESRISVAISHGISDARAIAGIISASDDAEAVKVALDYKTKNTVVVEQNEQQNKYAAMDDYFANKKKERGIK